MKIEKKTCPSKDFLGKGEISLQLETELVYASLVMALPNGFILSLVLQHDKNIMKLYQHNSNTYQEEDRFYYILEDK